MRYLDANVVVDALIDQGTASRVASQQLIARLLKGDEIVATTDLVLSEVVFILRTSRAGRLARADIASLLGPIIAAPGLRVANKPLWARALEIMSTFNVDLPDAQLVATMETTSDEEVYSFDTDFDRIPGVKRTEPFDQFRTAP